jgi:hypothetical protein
MPETEFEQALLAKLQRWVQPAPPDFRYGSNWALVLGQGRWFTPAPWPRGLAVRGRLRACFQAAERVAARTGLTYCEGFALDDLGVVDVHAWCARPDGTAVDPTWPDGVGRAYLGVPLVAEFLATIRARTRTRPGTSVFDHEVQAKKDDCRLLRDGVPDEAVAPIGRPLTST